MVRTSLIMAFVVLPLGFFAGKTAGPYITPTKPNIEKKSLHEAPKIAKMNFESAVKRTD